MMKFRKLVKLTAVATSTAIVATAARPIGAVEATGGFLLNGVPTANHATLLDGTVLENSRASSEVHINGGIYLVLSQDAKAEIHEKQASLLRGKVQIADAMNFSIAASGFKVIADNQDTTMVVSLDKATVQVGSLKGAGSVFDATGALIARITPAMSVSLKTGAESPQSMKLAGSLSQQNGRFYVEDKASHLRVEIIGKDFSSYVGQNVKLAGTITQTAPARGVAYTVSVDSIDRLPAGMVVAGGGAATAGTIGTTAGTGSAALTGSTVAIIGGVAVAGATGGTIAAIKMKSESSRPLSH